MRGQNSERGGAHTSRTPGRFTNRGKGIERGGAFGKTMGFSSSAVGGDAARRAVIRFSMSGAFTSRGRSVGFSVRGRGR